MAPTMTYLLLACQLILAIVLLLAATGKALSSDHFLAAIRLSLVPAALVIPIAVLVPAAEASLALALVVSPVTVLPLILLAILALLVGFTGWMLWMQARGMHLSCGCFGTGDAKIGRTTILRNVLLIAICLAGFGIALHHHSPLPAPSLWLSVSVACLAMCLALLRAMSYGRAALVLTEARREQLDRQSAQGDGDAVAREQV